MKGAGKEDRLNIISSSKFDKQNNSNKYSLLQKSPSMKYRIQHDPHPPKIPTLWIQNPHALRHLMF